MAMRVAAVGAMFEGQNAIIKARITTHDGVRLSTDGSAIPTAASVRVFDKHATPATALNTTTALVIATVFTTNAQGYLTTGWKKDSTGYNFLAVIPDGDGSGLNVPYAGGKSYTFEFSVTPPANQLTPGTQDEGAIMWAVEMFVEPTLGVT